MKRALLILSALFCMAAAAPPDVPLPDAAQETRARSFFFEVRCLVCQGESIAESNADIAYSLRQIVREQIAAGRSDREIRSYLVDRYGEFVLFRPALSLGNAALWLTPVLLVAIGAGLWLALLRRRDSGGADLTADEEARLAALGEDKGGAPG
jgi:cytochrome c-type biogenesis protein CcmH